MNKKHLALGLSADRIDVLLCQGDRVLRSCRVRVALDSDPEKWCKDVKDAANPLKAAAQQLGALGLTAQVLYQSPTECADYTSLNVKSGGEARQAAMLASAEKLNCPLDGAVFRTDLVGRDRAGDSPSLHVVVAADRAESLDAVTVMVERAGLVFGTATPVDAVAMSRLLHLGLAAREPRRAYLHVGEQRSFFVIADAGKVLFARPIAMGVNSLTTCLMRPMRGSGDAQAVELDRDTARLMLQQFGFPEPRTVVHESMGITGAQVLPLLQPVLQRYVVELRQSLRFALPEDQRGDVVVRMMGPGAALPGFCDILGTELRLAVEVDVAYRQYDCRKPDSPGGELIDALGTGRTLQQLGLEPREVEDSRQSARMRRWLWTGAAASLAVIGMDHFRNHARLIELRREAQIVASSTEQVKSMQATGERLQAAMLAMTALDNLIARETGARISPRAILQELSRIAPATIRLTDVSLRRTDDKVTGTISGYAFQDKSGSRNRDLEPFIDKLRQSPLFEDVALSNIQDGSLPNAPGQRFDAMFTGITAPQGQVGGPAVASAEGVSGP